MQLIASENFAAVDIFLYVDENIQKMIKQYQEFQPSFNFKIWMPWSILINEV